MSSQIDFAALRTAANSVVTRAYAPYSGFSVGVAGITETGVTVCSVNVENVSYGLGVCAEVGVVSAAVTQGAGRLLAVSVCDADGNVLAPCGRCRQVLLENGGPGLLVDGPLRPRPLSELLPDAFGPDDLERVAQ